MNEYLFYKLALFVDLLDGEICLALKNSSYASSCIRDASEVVEQLKRIVVEVKKNGFKSYDGV